jgi:hypothetical protein
MAESFETLPLGASSRSPLFFITVDSKGTSGWPTGATHLTLVITGGATAKHGPF